MQRNLNNRVETLFPLDSPVLRKAIKENVLDPVLLDTVNAHSLQPDGSYVPILPAPDQEPFDSQDWFISHPLIEIDEETEAADTTTISAIPSSA